MLTAASAFPSAFAAASKQQSESCKVRHSEGTRESGMRNRKPALIDGELHAFRNRNGKCRRHPPSPALVGQRSVVTSKLAEVTFQQNVAPQCRLYRHLLRV